jgi:hypothetical protein
MQFQKKDINTMSETRQAVIITDIRIPFWSMVILMVKWAIAAIPAVIILFFIASALGAALAAIFGTGWHHFGPGRWM